MESKGADGVNNDRLQELLAGLRGQQAGITLFIQLIQL